MDSIAPVFGAASSGVTLNDEELILGIILRLGLGQFIGDDEILALLFGGIPSSGFSRFPCRLSSFFGGLALLDEIDRELFMLGDVISELVASEA